MFLSILFYLENKDNLKRFSKITLLCFLASFVFSFILPLNSIDLNEKFFINSLFGRNWDAKLSKREEIEMANILKRFNCEKILTDDINNFEVVFFHGEVKKFILPYNYEFNTAVSNPYFYVDCVLLNSNDEDLKRNLGQSFKYFYLVAKTDKYFLYIKNDLK